MNIKSLCKNLTFQITICAIAGFLCAKYFADPSWVKASSTPLFYEIVILLKTSFLSLLKMMIAPMIFFSLIGGLINIGGPDKLKTMGKTAVTYYLSTTAIAILIGLMAVTFVHPWKSSNVVIEKSTMSSNMNYVKPKKFIDSKESSVVAMLTKMLKKSFVNPFDSLVSNNILGIVVFALFAGLALVITHPTGGPIFEIVQSINAVINKIIHWIILTTPVGIFAIVFDFKLKVSGDIFSELLSFALLVFGATMLHGLVVLPTIAYFFGGIKPIELFKKISNPLLVALSTASSSATLPISMATAEDKLGVSKGVSGFVFPLGATMNMDGTALFEGIAAVFLAHLFGIELGQVAMFSIFFMAMISSIGAPGMPSGSMSGMQVVLLAAGIPLEAIGILLVIEKPLDTFRTAVNVEGDIIGSVVVQKYHK